MRQLSILLPTYNRLERLKKTFPEIISNQSNKIEFVVVDNNSNDGTEMFIRKYAENDSRIRYFKNFRNLGPNRSLYRAVLEANSDWIVIIPDDDYVPQTYIDELLITIEKNKNCGLIITAKKNQDLLYQHTTKISNGIDALKVAYSHSSAITCLAWNKKNINEKKWLLDGHIYIQVRVSSEIAIQNDILYFVPKNMPDILNWDEDILFSDDKDRLFPNPRPDDFGFFELIDLLDDIKYNNMIKDISNFYYEAKASKILWISNVFNEMLNENESNAKKFFKVLVTHKSIRSCVIFWLIFINQHIRKSSLRFFILTNSLYGITRSLINIELYKSSFFLIKNLSKYINKYKSLSI